MAWISKNEIKEWIFAFLTAYCLYFVVSTFFVDLSADECATDQVPKVVVAQTARPTSPPRRPPAPSIQPIVETDFWVLWGEVRSVLERTEVLATVGAVGIMLLALKLFKKKESRAPTLPQPPASYTVDVVLGLVVVVLVGITASGWKPDVESVKEGVNVIQSSLGKAAEKVHSKIKEVSEETQSSLGKAAEKVHSKIKEASEETQNSLGRAETVESKSKENEETTQDKADQKSTPMASFNVDLSNSTARVEVTTAPRRRKSTPAPTEQLPTVQPEQPKQAVEQPEIHTQQPVKYKHKIALCLTGFDESEKNFEQLLSSWATNFEQGGKQAGLFVFVLWWRKRSTDGTSVSFLGDESMRTALTGVSSVVKTRSTVYPYSKFIAESTKSKCKGASGVCNSIVRYNLCQKLIDDDIEFAQGGGGRLVVHGGIEHELNLKNKWDPSAHRLSTGKQFYRIQNKFYFSEVVFGSKGVAVDVQHNVIAGNLATVRAYLKKQEGFTSIHHNFGVVEVKNMKKYSTVVLCRRISAKEYSCRKSTAADASSTHDLPLCSFVEPHPRCIRVT